MQDFSRPSRRTVIALAGAWTGVVAIGAPTMATAQGAGKSMTTPTGLQITDIKVGTGATPKSGQTCVMHYTGWLYENGAKGKKFDSHRSTAASRSSFRSGRSGSSPAGTRVSPR